MKTLVNCFMPAIYDGEPGALGSCINHFSSREKSGDVAPCQEEIGDGGALGRQQNVAAFHFFVSCVLHFSLCELLFVGHLGTSVLFSVSCFYFFSWQLLSACMCYVMTVEMIHTVSGN